MKRVTIHATIASILCIGTIVLYVVLYGIVETKSGKVVELQNQIDSRRETANNVASARSTLSEIAVDENIVRGYFVQETGVVSFIDSLESHGRAQKTVVNVLSVSKENTAGRSALSFSISIKGTFDAVMRTVGSIEYSPYDISVSTLSLGLDVKDSWHADMKLLVGYVPATAITNTMP